MRAETDAAKLKEFMVELGCRVGGPGRIYFAGGATALLHGWRPTTIAVDLKPDPEPPGLFEALAVLKDELDINVELASPDQFIPPVPGWRERSLSIARHGELEFFHYDPYGQVLSKLQRRHDRDIHDARSFLRDGLIDLNRLLETFELIEPELIRYPAVDAASFRSAVLEFAMKTDDLLSGLPGETLVRKGLADLKSGRQTTAACLAAIARKRLIAAGVVDHGELRAFSEPERQLYWLLRCEGGDAYSRYNSLLRELVSFEMALDRRNRTTAADC